MNDPKLNAALHPLEVHADREAVGNDRGKWPYRPDDTEADQAIADAETFVEAMWELAEKYDVPVTNNEPRWQDGRYLREVGSFIGEAQDIARRFPQPAPRTVSAAELDALANTMVDARYPEGFWVQGHSDPPEADDETVIRVLLAALGITVDADR